MLIWVEQPQPVGPDAPFTKWEWPKFFHPDFDPDGNDDDEPAGYVGGALTYTPARAASGDHPPLSLVLYKRIDPTTLPMGTPRRWTVHVLAERFNTYAALQAFAEQWFIDNPDWI